MASDDSQCFAVVRHKTPHKNLSQNAPLYMCVRLKQVIVLRHRIIFLLNKCGANLLWAVEEED